MLNLGFIGILMVMLISLSGCVLPEGTEPAQGFNWPIMGFMLFMFVVFYFLMIRPQRKRQKEQQTMMKELQKGDEVITTGGIYGQIDRMDDESIVLKIEGGTTIRIARSSVIGRRTKQ